MLAAVAQCDGGGGGNSSRPFGQEQRDSIGSSGG